MEDKITAVFTSCGRFSLLERTISSFMKYNTYPIEKFIIIDNSTVLDAKEILTEITQDIPNVKIIVNDENIGQVSSIDKAYALVDTDFIFHCEDDWEFFDSGFIEASLDVLNYRDDISNINLRIRFDGERGSMHPIIGPYKTDNGTIYHEYAKNYLNLWHGFSWNPGLRRLCDYDLVRPYKQYNNEEGVNKIMNELCFTAGCLNNSYCKHIGTHSTTPKSNS